jgi:hypothetical protein
VELHRVARLDMSNALHNSSGAQDKSMTASSNQGQPRDPKLGVKISFLGVLGMGIAALLAFLGFSFEVAVTIGFLMWVVVIAGMMVQRRINTENGQE